MKINCYRWLMVVVLGLFLTACQGDNQNDEPTEEGPMLSGMADMPKVVVTVFLSATPNVQPSPTPQPVTPTITETPEPPEPTNTPTAQVGVFVGENDEGGTPIGADLPPVIIPPVTGGGGGVVIVSTLPTNGGSLPVCTTTIDQSFVNAYSQNTQVANALGCPINAGYGLTLVVQTFERGQMFWRDSGEIYSMMSTLRFKKVLDEWRDGMPESDAQYTPPAGLLQPIRGFGLAWRNNQDIRDALGWGITGEAAILSYWQDFQNGYMFLADNNRVYVVIPDIGNPNQGQYYGPFNK